MKVAIVGTRNPSISYREFKEYLKDLEITEVVSGGAKGIDTYASEYAKEFSLPLREFLPNYNVYGRRAPLVRNTEIVEAVDILIAFPNKDSKGTYDSINKARIRGKQVKVFNI